MANVFLHTRPNSTGFDWTNDFREFARIPVVGEYLATDVTSRWYEVRLVVHTPFKADCEAEVYADEVPDYLAVMEAALAPKSGGLN